MLLLKDHAIHVCIFTAIILLWVILFYIGGGVRYFSDLNKSQLLGIDN